jgi:hypothetical protein
MSQPLILKTFSALSNVHYLDTFNRPARGWNILGIIVLLIMFWAIYQTNTEVRAYLLLASLFLLLVVVVVVVRQTYGLNPVIMEAANRNSLSLETKLSFNGERNFFPLSSVTGVVVGIILYSLLANFVYNDAKNIIIVLVLAIGVGVFLGVGLTYLYFEKKIDRPILVQKYKITDRK